MPSISVPVALGIGAVASGGAALASGAMQADAAKKASQQQSDAANKASDQQLAMFNSTQANLKPFVEAGQHGLDQLGSRLGDLTKPFAPTMGQLEQTPGYQFTKQQGLLGVQNSYAAQGLGASGAAAKGAANYAEGLASTTFQQQFQNYLGQNQQIYGMLSGLGQLGENAAAMTGQQGLQAASNSGSFLTAGAAAGAAGTVGAANAGANALNSLGGSASNLGLLYSLNSGGLFGTGSKP